MRDEGADPAVGDPVGDQGLDAERLGLGPQQRDLGLEVVDRVVLPVDAGEPQIRHLVQIAQRSEDGDADLVGRDLRLTGGADRVLDELPKGPTGKILKRAIKIER